jgi:hypothetical protein
MVGMNWETSPTQRPRASGYGTPIRARNRVVVTAETAASRARE